MDRRDFLKAILVTPLANKVLLASNAGQGRVEVFLISGDPAPFLPALLAELEALTPPSRSFAFLKPHPRQASVFRALASAGRVWVSNPEAADFVLSFDALRHQSRPSFTFARNGDIQDIRSSSLFSLWQEMHDKLPPSSLLTTASFKTNRGASPQGQSLSVFRGGKKIASLPLAEDSRRSFKTKDGMLTILVENGQARILSAPCRHKICQSMPPASLAGERIICAPTRFLFEVEGSRLIDTLIG